MTAQRFRLLSGEASTERQPRIEALIPIVQKDYERIANTEVDWENPTGNEESILVAMVSFKLQTLEEEVDTKLQTAGKMSHIYGENRSRGYPAYIVSQIQKKIRVHEYQI